jgi:long-chain-fatty-acid--CoA ligase ACSBG
LIYTTDIKVELPVFLSEQGNASIKPMTMMEVFEKTVKDHLKEEALFFERNNTWASWTWNHYNKEVMFFAKALINVGVDPYKSVNILGHNSPEWLAAFIGGMHACVVPVGIYNTNNSDTCVYIGEHSEVGCIVLDSLVQFRKYEKELAKLKHLKAIVFYCNLTEIELKSLVNPYCTVYIWNDFIELGKKATVDLELNNRIRMQKPGSCCNIVYTSGTTGFPKAVMLSHDNLTWAARSLYMSFSSIIGERHKMISFLPLSHIAGQIIDIVCIN